MKEAVAVLIVVLVLIAAVIVGKRRSKSSDGELGGKPSDPATPSRD